MSKSNPTSGKLKTTSRGSSPYSTGGGGVTFERRVAAKYLARLLTGSTAAELQGRRVRKISFQQAPDHQSDDLLITATHDDGTGIVQLEIAIRRAPAFTTSDKKTEKLIGSLLADLLSKDEEGEERIERWQAICVAGPQTPAEQVSQLAGLAKQQASESGFHSLVETPGKFRRALRKRLKHLVSLVAANLSPKGAHASSEQARLLTWKLLKNVEILMPRLEAPDETDWGELPNLLEPWAREKTIEAATALRDRLEALAASYAPSAADIDQATLRRSTNELLTVERRHRQVAWTELRRLDAEARSAVRKTIGFSSTPDSIHLSRPGPRSILHQELSSNSCLLISGESGVGKSALVMDELESATATDPMKYSFVSLNLRFLPPRMIELRKALRAPLEDLLSEMSTPVRILVLDAAEISSERDDQLLNQLLRAALAVDVLTWVISSTDGSAAVRAVMKDVASSFQEITIDGLEDTELEEVERAFPVLRRLVSEPRTKELLRRPAIIDLLIRSGSGDLPLSDADAFDIVWSRLVRRQGPSSSGLPEARDQVLCQLALQQLRDLDPELVYVSLDPAAISGLQHDGLLRPSNRWQSLPSFAHDLLRTYAVARILVSVEDPVEELIENSAPRWALPAMRLALQIRLSEPESPEVPSAGRLARWQAAMDRLSAEGYGRRWADLPTEALLTLPNSGEILTDAWQDLTRTETTGLQRVLRLIVQRFEKGTGIDPLVAEPLIALLLESGRQQELDEQVDQLLCGWLRSLIITSEPSGNRLRIALRKLLIARVAAGDDRQAEARILAEQRLAARTPAEVAEDEKRAQQLKPLLSPLFGEEKLARKRRELPRELTSEKLLGQLALLGTDLAEQGSALLSRVAADSPQHLGPAIENPLTGFSLASYNIKLLVQLIEAYYVDENPIGYSGMGDLGIRGHIYFGFGTPLFASYLGPFLALFRYNLQTGALCLNRLLNHAAKAHALRLQELDRSDVETPEHQYTFELSISGKTRRYVGESGVWSWYRGTSVGPYPCMSALLALELVCDEYLQAGVAPNALVQLILEGCENLAMPGLAVGVLVRNLERLETELDLFLVEPAIWRFEFARKVNEYSSLAAQTEGIIAPERRSWDLRDAATHLVLCADENRRKALRQIGQNLIARAAELEWDTEADVPLSEELATVKGWASSLDFERFTFTETEKGVLIQNTLDEQVLERLAPSNMDSAEGQETLRLLARYPERYHHLVAPEPINLNELLTDLATARNFVENPAKAGPLGPLDMPASVAAAALEAQFLDGLKIPRKDLIWAASLLVFTPLALASQRMSAVEFAVFGNGADRSAARALPLLLLPSDHELRELLLAEGIDDVSIHEAIDWIVEHGANESRLFLARAFDPLWRKECDAASGRCNHAVAFSVIEDIARNCLLGPWDNDQNQLSRIRIEGSVAPSLLDTKNDSIDVPRLTATIRGAYSAAVSSACCRTDAATLLTGALAAHRRGMRSFKNGYNHSSDDAAGAARAVLEFAASDDSSLVLAHIDEYADNPRLLSEFLRALNAAGEENQSRAFAAQKVWPTVIEQVIKIVDSETYPSTDYHFGSAPLAAAIPSPSYGSGYLHREFESEPISWADPVKLAAQIDQWIPVAAGQSESIDAMAELLEQLPVLKQAQLGLPWIEQLVMASPERIASRSFHLSKWLERIQPHARSKSLREAWHRIVDTLTVEGDTRIARLAD